MSTIYKMNDIVATNVLANRLEELSDAIGKSGDEMSREFTRRIPAELDRDADLVLSQSARRMTELEAQLAKVTAERDEYIKFHTENLPLISYIAIETVNVKVDGDIKSRFGFYLAKRDLEQQAIGVEYFANNKCNKNLDGEFAYKESMLYFSSDLRKQANELGKDVDTNLNKG